MEGATQYMQWVTFKADAERKGLGISRIVIDEHRRADEVGAYAKVGASTGGAGCVPADNPLP